MDAIISIFECEISRLKDAVLTGTYGTRSIVGDAVINLSAALSLLKDQNLQQQNSAAYTACPECGEKFGHSFYCLGKDKNYHG